MRKAFTLIELLVVIGILAVLGGVLVGAIGGTSESARGAKCLANMKNLAAAVQAYGSANRYYPHAGSIERMNIDTSQGAENAKLKYREQRGWISWASEGMYPSDSPEGAPTIPMGTTDELLGAYALTNGALWRYVSGNKSVYVCPLHAKLDQNVRWSYLMNAYFGWSAAEGYAYSSRHTGVEYGTLKGAERRLLFSEIQFSRDAKLQEMGYEIVDGTEESTKADAILQYKGSKKSPQIAGSGARDGNECIGVNHKNGRNWLAHVVFADGHTEKIRVTNDKGVPIDQNNLRELTTWLCQGKAVTFDGNRYEELD